MIRSGTVLMFVSAGLVASTACIELYEHHPPTCHERRLAVCPGDGGMGGDDSGEGGTSAGSGNGGSGTSGSAGATAGSAGQGGDAGGGGSAGTEPCDGACGGATSVCDETRDVCVECLEHPDCSEATPFCDTVTTGCVECLRSSDCMDSDASRCNEGRCAGCESNADCTHVDGLGVCDVDTGACVECTVETEATACGANSCNPATNECTTTPRGSVSFCRPCVADSECVGGNAADPDSRCVPTEFQGQPRPGGYCFRRVSKTCARPFTVTFSASSLSGSPAEAYCGIDQENVRCEAVLDLQNSRECVDGADSQCGCTRGASESCTDAGLGGLCRTVGGVPEQCTYRCGTNNHCPVGLSCVGVPTSYCQ